MVEEIKIKKCNKCGEEKPLDEFYSRQCYSKKRGIYTYYFPTCKKCDIKRAWQNLLDNWERGQKRREEYEERQGVERTLNKRKNSERQRLAGKQKQWQIENSDKVKEYSKNRRMKNHNITKKEWETCKKYFDYECAYCGLPIEEHYRMYAGELQKIDLHKEHADHEGSSGLDNCVPACQSCNDKKWKFKLEDWYNEENPNFSQERLNKILEWLNGDWEQFYEEKKPRAKYSNKKLNEAI